MPTFPTLSISPSVDGFAGRPALDDPTYRSPKESGRIKTSAKVSWVPTQFPRRYDYLPQTDKNTLWAFERHSDVFFGAGTFDWINHEDGETYVVRFAEPVTYKLQAHDKWLVTMVLEEAQPHE